MRSVVTLVAAFLFLIGLAAPALAADVEVGIVGLKDGSPPVKKTITFMMTDK